MGFVTPEEIWMKETLRPFVLAVLSADSFRARPYWNADAVMKDYLAFLEGSRHTPRRYGGLSARNSGSGNSLTGKPDPRGVLLSHRSCRIISRCPVVIPRDRIL